MTKRIFRSIWVVALSVFMAAVLLFLGILYGYFSDIQRSQLRTETALAVQGVTLSGADYFDGLDCKACRITWIDTDGTVLYDSISDSSDMENHLQREEIKQALADGTGESTRYSTTLAERFFYCAQQLPDGTLIRLSIAQNSIFSLLLGMMQPICLIFVIAFILSLLLASRSAKKIVQPLNALNLDKPLDNDGYAELSPLLRRLDHQQREIRLQKHQLMQKQQEFEAVISNMTEGIILLNQDLNILSINPSAKRLFNVVSVSSGTSILSVCRNSKMQELLHLAKEKRHAEAVLELNHQRYQLSASPILSDEELLGIVLLLLDVTEKEKAEQMRREFTANVSHELKTPLHTISGCAELMCNGLVKAEDMPRFSSQIYSEAQRMTQLIEDIIELSHLDEGAEDLTWESADLYALTRQAAESLQPQAQAANIDLTVEGTPCPIHAIPRLVLEIVCNLCDNAIKYNHPGGSVHVSVKPEGDSVLLTVSDTGIGIPDEHKDRIFERFYRVDKSHSKAIGGTGLGLSIVKHAAWLHGASITLNSKPNQGTVITVAFPAQNEKH